MTLIETICAAAILAVAIVGLTNVTATSAALHRAGVEKSAAMRAAERQLATVVASDFATLQADWNGAGFAVGLEGKGGAALRPLPNDPDGMAGSVQVTAPSGDPAELVEIAVRVDWVSAHGPQALVRRMRLSRLGS
jgi:hypothetical protein